MPNAGRTEWPTRTASHAAGALVSAMLSLTAPAAIAVTIAPVMVELSAQKSVVSVRVLNDSTAAMTFQAQTLLWQQPEGEDQYSPTPDLLVAPAIAVIAPGASQIFRVTLRRPTSAVSERAYRLILEDVSIETTPQPGVVNLRFRHNLPLFVLPRNKPFSSAKWSRCAAPANKTCIRIDNQGNSRVRLSNISVEGQDWHKSLGGGVTVLAGAWRQWLFELQSSQSTGLRIIATSDTGQILKPVELP